MLREKGLIPKRGSYKGVLKVVFEGSLIKWSGPKCPLIKGVHTKDLYVNYALQGLSTTQVGSPCSA